MTLESDKSRFGWEDDDLELKQPGVPFVRAYIVKRTANSIKIIFTLNTDGLKGDGETILVPGDTFEGWTFKELAELDISIDNRIPMRKN